MYNKIKSKKSIRGFSLVELAIVILIIALVVAGVVGGKALIMESRLAKARKLTENAIFTANDNLVVWLEPTMKNAFKITKSDGDEVSEWMNRINRHMNSLQTITDSKPTYVSNGIGKVPSVRFDGTNDFLEFESSSISALNPAEFTIFVVCSVAGGEETYRSPLGSRSTSDTTGYMFYAASTNVWSFWYGLGSGWQQLAKSELLALNSPTILMGMQDGTTMNFYVNNVAGTTSANTFARNSTFRTRIGDISGGGAGVTYPWNGDVSEIIIFNSALNDVEKDEVYDYLSKKYNIR